MSLSPFFFVERFNYGSGKWELQHPKVLNEYSKEYEFAELFPYNGSHDLFSIMENKSNAEDFPVMHGIHSGLPRDCCEEIRNEYKECCCEEDGSSTEKFLYPVHWVTYADMYIYCLSNPTVVDYAAMDGMSEQEIAIVGRKNITMPTPVKALMNRVNSFLDVMDSWGWEDDYSMIRIVYWII